LGERPDILRRISAAMCEIELPLDLDDAVFLAEAYRAILLRGPQVAETDQYLRLLRDGAVSRTWIIEDLLASEPGASEAGEMATVIWLCGGLRLMSDGSDRPAFPSGD